MRFARILVIACMMLSLSTTVLGADQTIRGKSLKVVEGVAGQPSTRSLFARAKEAASANSLVGDPLTHGATLQVVLDGAAPSSQTFDLPAGLDARGRPYWYPTTGGFKYRDRDGENGAVSRFSMRQNASGLFSMRAKLQGRKGPIEFTPPGLGGEGYVVLDLLGGGDRYCVYFGGEGAKIRGTDQSLRVTNPVAEQCPGCTTPPEVTDGDGSSCIGTPNGEPCTTWTCQAPLQKTGSDPVCEGNGGWAGSFRCAPSCAAGDCEAVFAEHSTEIRSTLAQGDSLLIDLTDNLLTTRQQLAEELVLPDPDPVVVSRLESEILGFETRIVDTEAFLALLRAQELLVSADLMLCSGHTTACTEGAATAQSCGGLITCADCSCAIAP